MSNRKTVKPKSDTKEADHPHQSQHGTNIAQTSHGVSGTGDIVTCHVISASRHGSAGEARLRLGDADLRHL